MRPIRHIAGAGLLLGAAACNAGTAAAPRPPAAAVDTPTPAPEERRMTPPTTTTPVPRTPSGAVMPPIDARAPATVATATFAMG